VIGHGLVQSNLGFRELVAQAGEHRVHPPGEVEQVYGERASVCLEPFRTALRKAGNGLPEQDRHLSVRLPVVP
jgi:hypothetical protein